MSDTKDDVVEETTDNGSDTIVEDTSHDDAHAGHDDHDGHDDHGGHHTSLGLSNVKLAMWLFLGSECLLFGGLISTG